MMGNHRTSCTFTLQQIGRWVGTHSKADSNLHGHGLAISRKQCPLWILFMSQHLNPPFALSDHRESVAWLISNGPHSVAYCHKLGPNWVKIESICPQKAATIFQHTHTTADCAWPRPRGRAGSDHPRQLAEDSLGGQREPHGGRRKAHKAEQRAPRTHQQRNVHRPHSQAGNGRVFHRNVIGLPPMKRDLT